MHHPQCQSSICTRPDSQPEIRLIGYGRRPRIDQDQVFGMFQGIKEPDGHFSIRIGKLYLFSPGYMGLREFPSPAMVIAIKSVEPKGGLECLQSGEIADMARPQPPVSGSYGIPQPYGIPVVTPAGTLAVDYGIGTVSVDQVPHFPGNGFKGFFPFYSLPLPFASFTHPFQRVLKTIRMVYVLDGGQPFAAHGSLGIGVGIAFDVCNHPVLDCHENTATAMATLTGTFYDFLCSHILSSSKH
jgi:hypothetical protein